MTFVWILLAGAVLFYGLKRLRAPSAPAEPRTRVVDSRKAGGRASGAIPRIIWSYWHGGEQPEVVRACLRNWAALNPGYEIRVVSAADLAVHVDVAEVPDSFHRSPPARQSDWLRLYFLKRYGGIWLDASIILTRSLDWMIEVQSQSGADYVGYYLDRYTLAPERPVMDSWCMAAPAGSALVTDWFNEMHQGAFILGDAGYLQALENSGQSARVLQAIASPDYMMIHVTGQDVLHRGGAYRLHLRCAEDCAYFYQALHGWRLKRLGLFVCLLYLRSPRHAPAMIKLRGGERRKLEPYLQRRIYTQLSLVGRLLSA
ncbi:MAG: capsular polysaccharide synthesis protein [Burkholderiaceae bacterium]|jgi:hypothetical protein|nr:capsular polysaccharide synthesis protein [Burkholderiaceae bacterium]